MDLTATEFELLLCEFCKQDLPPHFNVEHDEKEIGGESGVRRQIDTKIHGRIGISNILICGEAKNWNTPVGIQIIDEVVGKYFSGEVRANKVILFSKQGYTESAITRAKTLGIELLEPWDLGIPIKPLPYIVGVGYLGLMIVKVWHKSPQENLMAVDMNDYIILRGEERISFQQMVFRNVVNQLRDINHKSVYSDLEKINVKELSVLYELKQKLGYLYNGNFEIEVNLTWDYFIEYLKAGLLRHVNTGEVQFVELQGNPFKMISGVLMSASKINYERKEDVVTFVKEHDSPCFFQLVFNDPDQHRNNPQNPLFQLL